MDEQWPEDLSLKLRAFNLLLKLASCSQRLPSSLFISGVEIESSRDPVFQGGLSDIFIGEYEARAIALKRLRAIFTAEKKQHRVSI
jgi:hypothetical protein